MLSYALNRSDFDAMQIITPKPESASRRSCGHCMTDRITDLFFQSQQVVALEGQLANGIRETSPCLS